MAGEPSMANHQHTLMMCLVLEYAAPRLNHEETVFAQVLYQCISSLRMHSSAFEPCEHRSVCARFFFDLRS